MEKEGGKPGDELPVAHVVSYKGPKNKAGLKEGEGGICVYADGSRYQGAFARDKRNGSGSLTHADGSILRAIFADDVAEGEGTWEFANGD
ncbi:hypothetical protein NSK_002057, partial [Nannochloropsis salina CCMP1776]